MKRFIIVILTLAVVISAAYTAGRAAGIRHAITDAATWSEEAGRVICLELDGQIYEYDAD